MNESSHINYVFHLWFKILRKTRLKHKLSINTLLVLNGCYLYCKLISPTFSKTSLARFVTYYNIQHCSKYVNVLVFRGYVVETGMYKGNPQYKINASGMTVIGEIQENYDSEMKKFIGLYSL